MRRYTNGIAGSVAAIGSPVRLLAAALALGLAPGLASLSCAAEEPGNEAPAATGATHAPAGALTTKDPKIALDDLEILPEPMTKDEIGVEANGWFDLVRAKGREIAAAELDVYRKNREIAQLEKQKAAAAELAKAMQKVKAASETASDKDKAADAEHLEEAQRKLAKTVETANKKAAKEETKAEAVA